MKDAMSLQGAERLARKVSRYWRKQGLEVMARVERISMGDAEIYVVRSDMVNGLPAR